MALLRGPCMAHDFHTFPVVAQASLHVDDDPRVVVLKQFFQLAGGPSWFNKTGWQSQDIDVCAWFGITCSSGDVTTLNLRNNHLTGRLDALFGVLDCETLSSLQVLRLNENAITGTVPHIKFLRQLANLQLGSNRLRGAIADDTFAKAPMLWNIGLEVNELSGPLPDLVAFNPSLRRLYTDNNQFIGPLPSNLGSLEHFAVSSNPLHTTIPNFVNCSRLRVLYISYSFLHGTVPQFENCTLLTEILLPGNTLSGPIPEFHKLPSLQYIWLSDNQLSGTVSFIL